MVMPTTTLSVLWKDSNRRGLRGVVEIPISALSFENARISDLIEEFNHRTQGICREVESILLYGTRLSTERRLQAIIPDLKGSSPRLIATMQVPSADTFDKVVVTETLTGKRTLIPYMPRETVASFKNQLQDIEGIPASEQILAFNNTRLEDQRTLQSYNIKARSKIYLVWTLNGGYIPSRGILGSHYTSVLAKHDPVNAPRWRVAYEGLNIEGICKNRLCAAFRQMIIYPYQFESFNLVLEGCIQCPSCHLSVKPVTCGFCNCTWKFEGIRSHDEVSVSSAWKKASGNAYHYLNTGVTCVQWRSLLILIKPRLVSTATNLETALESSEVTVDDTCTICWTTFWFITITTAPCGHKFHHCCFDKWSKWCSNHDLVPCCPVCRKPVQNSGTPYNWDTALVG